MKTRKALIRGRTDNMNNIFLAVIRTFPDDLDLNWIKMNHLAEDQVNDHFV